MVVVGGERVELGLQLGEGSCGGLGGQPFLDCLLESFDLALGLRLTGQSKIILWITVAPLLAGVAAAVAFELAELFFVAADFACDGFEAAA